MVRIGVAQVVETMASHHPHHWRCWATTTRNGQSNDGRRPHRCYHWTGRTWSHTCRGGSMRSCRIAIFGARDHELAPHMSWMCLPFMCIKLLVTMQLTLL
jgi:hypothetical protein